MVYKERCDLSAYSFQMECEIMEYMFVSSLTGVLTVTALGIAYAAGAASFIACGWTLIAVFGIMFCLALFQ